MKIFGGDKSKYFAKEICENLGIELGKSHKEVFSDGEFKASLEETVRGENIYLVQSTFQPAENLLELLQLIDACRRSDAKKIIVVMPYFGFARQEKKDRPREPITASLIANILEAAGASHIITMDLHSDQIQGFFKVPVSHLYSSAIFVPFMRKDLLNDKIMIVSPDMGGSKRAKAYSQYFSTDMAICYKYRTEKNKVNEMMVIGDVIGRDCLIVDDIIDTAGTLCKCADLLIEKGANSVRAAITHPILSGNAYENIGKSKLTEIIVTNSIPLRTMQGLRDCEIIGFEKVVSISVASLFANVINNIENHTSISAIFL
jgi:ribose-phosphate pyrophosphokinase